MTITQLEYIIAVQKNKSFVKAAKACYVTQSTLSMQIKKLEESLNVLIFDRSKKPVQVTFIGEQIMNQAMLGLSELDRIHTIIQSSKEELAQQIRIGIIPTLSPSLVPMFLVDFSKKYPNIEIKIQELLTEEILFQLYNNQLDVGLIVTPLDNAKLTEIPLFYEPFVGYVSPSHTLSKKTVIQPKDLNLSDLWLLESGHCFKSQVLKICQQKESEEGQSNLHFESGSLQTLKKIVDGHHGYTLLPELSIRDFSEKCQSQVRHFANPVPVREVSLVFHQSYIKRHTIEVLKQEIQEKVPKEMLIKPKGATVVEL